MDLEIGERHPLFMAKMCESFKHRMLEDSEKWRSCWDRMEGNQNLTDIYSITCDAVLLCKLERRYVGLLENTFSNFSSVMKRSQNEYQNNQNTLTNLSEYHQSLVLKYEKLEQEWNELEKNNILEDGFNNDLTNLMLSESGQTTNNTKQPVAFSIDFIDTSLTPAMEAVEIVNAKCSQINLKTGEGVNGKFDVPSDINFQAVSMNNESLYISSYEKETDETVEDSRLRDLNNTGDSIFTSLTARPKYSTKMPVIVYPEQNVFTPTEKISDKSEEKRKKTRALSISSAKKAAKKFLRRSRSSSHVRGGNEV